MTKGKIALAVILALALGISASTVALADKPESLKISVCHKDGRSGNYSLVNVNINSTDDADGLNGHGDHGDDSWASFSYGGTNYPGQGDFPGRCGEVEPTAPPLPPPPTDVYEPTATPTDIHDGCENEGTCETPTAEPTIEPTSTEPGPSPDPTDIGPTPTDSPTEPSVVYDRSELPSTGDGLSPEAWLCWGENVWCAHNGVDGSEGELWVFLYPGAAFEFHGLTYEVVSTERVTPDMVQSLDDAGDYSIGLVTCSNYIGGVWVNRVIVFANRVSQ